MSVEAITWAIEQHVEPSSAKFVLVMIANCANSSVPGEFIAWPSAAYLAKSTNQDRKTVQANLRRLRELGYIEDTGERTGRTGQIIVYRLKTPENGTVQPNRPENGPLETGPNFPRERPVFPAKEAQISRERGPKTGHGTVRNHKGTVREPNPRARPIALPEWLPAEAWAMWDRYRASRKGWTADAKRLSIRKLEVLREQGHDPSAVIEQSVERGWTGLFPTRDDLGGYGPKAPPEKPGRYANTIAALTGAAHQPEIIDAEPSAIRSLAH